MTKREDKEDIESYRKFLIGCATGKETFFEITGKAGNLKFKPLSALQNKKSRELTLIGFINNVLENKK